MMMIRGGNSNSPASKSVPSSATTTPDKVDSPSPDSRDGGNIMENVAPEEKSPVAKAKRRIRMASLSSDIAPPDAEEILAVDKVQQPVVPGDDDNGDADSTATGDDNVEEPIDSEAAKEEEEDEEVRMAMEMALAAAQNPKLTPAQIRKLVATKFEAQRQQQQIVQEVELAKQTAAKQESAAKWEEQKREAYVWFQKRTVEAQATALELSKQAELRAQKLQDDANKRRYAEDIKKDEIVLMHVKKLRILTKTLKAHKLQGNREETRQTFKRQRLDSKYMATSEKLGKVIHAWTDGKFNINEYAKAMIRASKRWKDKKPTTDAELALEAQLCRNMHQMLVLEKQCSKLKKSTRELKKYLQRCKGWLSDKKAFCEMHIMTLSATASSQTILYEETLNRQDALIAKLLASEEFANLNLKELEAEERQNVGSTSLIFDQVHGAGGMLHALRGLPFRDSIRMKRRQAEMDQERSEKEAMMAAALEKAKNEDSPIVFMSNFKSDGPDIEIKILPDAPKEAQVRAALKAQKAQAAAAPDAPAKGKSRFVTTNSNGQNELYVEMGDTDSVSSAISDPDDEMEDDQNDEIRRLEAEVEKEDEEPDLGNFEAVAAAIAETEAAAREAKKAREPVADATTVSTTKDGTQASIVPEHDDAAEIANELDNDVVVDQEGDRDDETPEVPATDSVEATDDDDGKGAEDNDC
jgi:hypothetical protein